MSKRVLDMAAFPIKTAAERGLFETLGIEHALGAYYRWWEDKGKAAQKQAEEKRNARGSNVPAPAPAK